MNFTDIFIRRPIFAISLSLMLFVTGLAAFIKMPVRQFPEIATSVVTVTTTYPGASAELMAGFVSTPLENAIGTIDGIDYMTSSSVGNRSTITVNLKLGYPIEKAVTDIANEVNSVIWKLPSGIQNPVIAKQDPNATPTMYIAFKSDKYSPEAVTDYLLRVVQPMLSTLNGVSQASILGERQYAMRISLDPQKMAAHGITATDIWNALSQQNLQAAAGTVYSKLQQFNVKVNSDMQRPDEFNTMIIKTVNGETIRLQDVGYAQLGAENDNSSAVIDGKQTTVIGIITTSDANPLNVSDEVNRLLPKIEKNLPKGIHVEVAYDQSVFIKASIHEVYETMVEAALCVLLVIFIFLGSLRSVLIPIITIPLSLIGVAGIMLALGYTINTITLLAWVLAIGLVVDDAIVVLENIYRHMEEGLSPIPAAIIGAREIGFAIVAMTLTLATVYAPIGFTGGLTGILFSEFAFTLSFSVVISGFIALTLSPMMCSRMIRYTGEKNNFSHRIDEIFETLVVKYKAFLRTALDKKKMILIFAGLLYLICFVLFQTLPQELAPMEDQGSVLVWVNGPSSGNIKYTEKYTNMMIPIFNKIPEAEHYGIINGFGGSVTSAMGFIRLKDWSERSRNATRIQMSIFPALWAIPGLKIFPLQPQPLPNTGSIIPIQFVLKSTDNVDELLPAVEGLMQAASQNPMFMNVDADLKYDKPRIRITINRNKAGNLGVPIAEITNSLNIMLGQPENVQFSMADRGYYVIPEYTKNYDFLTNPNDIKNIYVHTESGTLVPLSNVVDISMDIEPQSINHFQQLPSATINANFKPGYTLGQALDFLTNYTKEHFPNLQYDYAGQARQFYEASSAMQAVMLFAMIFIFLMLSAQFESFRDPIIILAVVPLTMAGALFTLKLTGGTLNIYSKIGLVTLIGLIAKHGILIVEFANQLQEKGASKLDAVIEAASLRLRPILMTTGAMVLGALPLAIASGAGAAARHALGWVIVGGMSFGTLFSLIVVPTLYILIAKVKFIDVKLEKEIAEAVDRAKKLHEHSGK
jgi:multidrug efflux pump